MKFKLTTLTLLLFIGSNLFSRTDWAPIGTTWYYNFHSEYSVGYIKMESVKDTLVEGKRCKYLKTTEIIYANPGNYVTKPYEYGGIITYQSGDTIYIYNRNAFAFYYNFNAKSGDIWDLWNTTDFITDTITCAPGKVIVDSVKQTLIDNISRNVIYTSAYNGSPVQYNDKIIEGIGCLGGVYPVYEYGCNTMVDYPEIGYLRCFHSNNIDTLLTQEPCDYINSASINKTEQQIYISPNPVNDAFQLKGAVPDFLNYIIFALSGKPVQQGTVANKTIKVSSLPNGIYFLQMQAANGKTKHIKFVKEAIQ